MFPPSSPQVQAAYFKARIAATNESFFGRRTGGGALPRYWEGAMRDRRGASRSSHSSLSLSFFFSPSHLFVCVLPARFHKLIYQRGIQ